MDFDKWFAQAHALAWETIQRNENSPTALRDRQLYELEKSVWLAAQSAQREVDAAICDTMYENGPIRNGYISPMWKQAWGSGVLDVENHIRTQGGAK